MLAAVGGRACSAPADSKHQLVAAARFNLHGSSHPASRRKPAFLGDPDRSEVPGVDFKQDLAESEIRESPVHRQPHRAWRYALTSVRGEN